MAASTNGEGASAGAADPLRLEALVRGLGILAGDVRVATGTTPKDVVWTRNKTVLYRYRPVAPRAHATPVLVVYALINKPYILEVLREFVGDLVFTRGRQAQRREARADVRFPVRHVPLP